MENVKYYLFVRSTFSILDVTVLILFNPLQVSAPARFNFDDEARKKMFQN